MQNNKKVLYLGIELPSTHKDSFHYPLIKVKRRALEEVHSSFLTHSLWTHIVLTSKQAVRFFFEVCEELSISPTGKQFILVGRATEQELQKRGEFRKEIAQEECGEGIVAILKTLPRNVFVFFPHSSLARPLIEDFLKESKKDYQCCVLYDTLAHHQEPLLSLEQFEEIVFTSPSCVAAFQEIFHGFPRDKKLSAIGPVTQKRLDYYLSLPYGGSINSWRLHMAKKFTLPNLPYDYKALEPVISGEIMTVHHQKHHQAYVTNLNAALEKYEAAESKEDLDTMISLQPAIRFNGGGHINHSIFWTNLAPVGQGGGVAPKGELATQIEKQWGSLTAFIEKFNGIAGPVQGSGWCWLCYCKETKRLLIETCANQDPLQATKGYTPLLGIDVWEHAYYLQYKNVRPDYLKAIWQVVNWANVAERYEKAVQLASVSK